MQKREQLRMRWLTPEGTSVRRTVLEKLRARDKHWAKPLQALPYSNEIPQHEDLRGIDLSGEDLNGIDVPFSALDGARLDGARLEHAGLANVHMPGASFVGAQLAHANLGETFADEAAFDGADLSGAHLTSSRLRGASFQGATLVSTQLDKCYLANVDFTGAKTEQLNVSGSDLTGALWDGSKGRVLGVWYATSRAGLVPNTPLAPVMTAGADPSGVRRMLVQLEGTIADSPERCFSFDQNGVATLTVGDHRYSAGRFYTPSLAELRARLEKRPKSEPGRIRLIKLAGSHSLTDIGTLQATAPDRAIFQVASQFNALSGPGRAILPIHRYLDYPSQGTRASISTFPGTFLRHYFAPAKDGQRFEQTDAGSLDLLANVFDASAAHIRAGHLSIANVQDRTRLTELLEQGFEQIRVGVHDQLEVVLGYNWGGTVPNGPSHRIAQVFTSTVALGLLGPDRTWQEVAISRSLLRAAYLGTLLAAIDLRRNQVVLTLLGGGGFGNLESDVAEAIYWAVSEAEPYVDGTLTVIVNTRSRPDCIPDHTTFNRGGMPLTFEADVVSNRAALPNFERIWQNSSWADLREPRS